MTGTPSDRDIVYGDVHDMPVFIPEKRANALTDTRNAIRGSSTWGEIRAARLGGHLKTGQSWTPQNRPVRRGPKHEPSTAVDRARASALATLTRGIPGYGPVEDRALPAPERNASSQR
jgi:hypothetical protein